MEEYMVLAFRRFPHIQPSPDLKTTPFPARFKTIALDLAVTARQIRALKSEFQDALATMLKVEKKNNKRSHCASSSGPDNKKTTDDQAHEHRTKFRLEVHSVYSCIRTINILLKVSAHRLIWYDTRDVSTQWRGEYPTRRRGVMKKRTMMPEEWLEKALRRVKRFQKKIDKLKEEMRASVAVMQQM